MYVFYSGRRSITETKHIGWANMIQPIRLRRPNSWFWIPLPVVTCRFSVPRPGRLSGGSQYCIEGQSCSAGSLARPVSLWGAFLICSVFPNGLAHPFFYVLMVLMKKVYHGEINSWWLTIFLFIVPAFLWKIIRSYVIPAHFFPLVSVDKWHNKLTNINAQICHSFFVLWSTECLITAVIRNIPVTIVGTSHALQRHQPVALHRQLALMRVTKREFRIMLGYSYSESPGRIVYSRAQPNKLKKIPKLSFGTSVWTFLREYLPICLFSSLW